MLEFGEYMPDLPPLLNPGLTRAEGIIPLERGYGPIPQLSILTSTGMDNRAQGIVGARAVDAVGTTYIYTGDSTKLYVVSGSSFTDVSGAVYTTPSDGRWEFAQWGNQIIATNFSDVVQQITIGGANFAALGGSPPKARHVAAVDNFLVLGNLDDGTDRPQGIAWSDRGDITNWSTGLSDLQDLQNNGGWVQGIVGGDFGIIFQEYMITRMSYIGAPFTFQLDTVEQERGALAVGSILPVGRNIAYLAADGFFMFDGAQSHPIGDGKLDEAVLGEDGPLAINRNYLDRVYSCNYPAEKICVWSYSSAQADPSGINDVMLFYNYAPQSKTRWSVLRTNTTDAIAGTTDINHYVLGAPLSTGYTLDGLDAVSTNIDALPEAPPNDISLDSPFWTGQQRALGVINSDNKLAFFDDTTYYDAFIETGEHQLNPPNRTSITMIRPFVNTPDGSSTITVAMSARNTEQVTASFSNTVALNSSGFANVRSNGRFQRAQVIITGGFVHAEGIDVIQATKVGRR